MQLPMRDLALPRAVLDLPTGTAYVWCVLNAALSADHSLAGARRRRDQARLQTISRVTASSMGHWTLYANLGFSRTVPMPFTMASVEAKGLMRCEWETRRLLTSMSAKVESKLHHVLRCTACKFSTKHTAQTKHRPRATRKPNPRNSRQRASTCATTTHAEAVPAELLVPHLCGCAA